MRIGLIAAWGMLLVCGCADRGGGESEGTAPASARSHVRFLLVGDSTVTENGGWGVGFKGFLEDSAECVNRARAGRSSKSYRDEGAWDQAMKEKADYVLIQFGHNDMPGKGADRETDAATTFRQNMARYVEEARGAGMRPVLVTSLARRTFSRSAPGKIDNGLAAYVEGVKAVAAEKKVPLVDLNARSIELCERLGAEKCLEFNPPSKDGRPDSTHLNAAGSVVFARLVVEELKKVAPELRGHLRDEPRAVAATLPATKPTVEPAIKPVIAPIAPVATTKSHEKSKGQWSPPLRNKAGWYASAEAVALGDNVLLYQRESGGWPKNTSMSGEMDESEREKIEAAKSRKDDSTFDNGATYPEIRYLAMVYAATRQERFKEGFDKGVDYLLKAQYPNGGWPQFYPLRKGYYTHITFNDGAMTGVMRELRDIAAKKSPFEIVDEERRARCQQAVAKGIECILKCQIKVNGKLAGWCAQHDEVTCAPAAARAYEKPSISGSEGADVVRFLMEIENPSPQVIEAVQGAAAWFESAKITGIRLEKKEGDLVVVKDAGAPPLWARFYEIGTNRPIFCSRDSVVRYDISEISKERRNGYRWYGDWAARLLEKEYPEWKGKWVK